MHDRRGRTHGHDALQRVSEQVDVGHRLVPAEFPLSKPPAELAGQEALRPTEVVEPDLVRGYRVQVGERLDQAEAEPVPLLRSRREPLR